MKNKIFIVLLIFFLVSCKKEEVITSQKITKTYTVVDNSKIIIKMNITFTYIEGHISDIRSFDYTFNNYPKKYSATLVDTCHTVDVNIFTAKYVNNDGDFIYIRYLKNGDLAIYLYNDIKTDNYDINIKPCN